MSEQMIWVPALKNYVVHQPIAHISEEDVDKHFLDLSEILVEERNIISVILTSKRMSGIGNLIFYHLEDEKLKITDLNWGEPTMVLLNDGTNRIQYSLSNAGDDFDLFYLGHMALRSPLKPKNKAGV